MSDQCVLAELMGINRNLEIIIGLLRDQQPQFSQVEYYVGGCDHQWVPTELQHTGPVDMHCAKCGAIRALAGDQNTLRRQARISLKMEEPWVYVQLREDREQIKRLEAAFLKAEKANLMHHMDADYADENAREALERIKEGGKSA